MRKRKGLLKGSITKHNLKCCIYCCSRYFTCTGSYFNMRVLPFEIQLFLYLYSSLVKTLNFFINVKAEIVWLLIVNLFM